MSDQTDGVTHEELNLTWARINEMYKIKLKFQVLWILQVKLWHLESLIMRPNLVHSGHFNTPKRAWLRELATTSPHYVRFDPVNLPNDTVKPDEATIGAQHKKEEHQ